LRSPKARAKRREAVFLFMPVVRLNSVRSRALIFGDRSHQDRSVLELLVLLARAIALACRGHHDIVLENLALRHQLRTLQRSVKRPHLRTRDRLFWVCKDLLRQMPQQAGDREELRKLLNRPSGGVIFATLQKFSPEQGTKDYPVLTTRRNVIVIADEAHRSQYGFAAKVERQTGEVSYGFAKYMRDALPNASFIGFTGTPIEKEGVNTSAVFGEYIDIYDISRAVEDGATVPIYYESRLARIELVTVIKGIVPRPRRRTTR
jgi:hypothetical protein